MKQFTKESWELINGLLEQEYNNTEMEDEYRDDLQDAMEELDKIGYEDKTEKELKKTAKWEYFFLIRDLSQQDEKEAVEELIETGFESWYKNVFLVDEAWEEIKEDIKNSKKEK